MRSLRQPGPVHPNRIESFLGDPQLLVFGLAAGATLNEALTGPLVAAGFQTAAITFKAAALEPFRYVTPAPASVDDPLHVAYFSAPHEPSGTSRVELANATFGWAAGKPFVHCHAVWRDVDGDRRGGHILPHETRLAEAAEATAWGFFSIRVEAAPDAETNFLLLQPSGHATKDGHGVVARVKPNEDISTAIETIAAAHGITDGVLRGSLGSLIGASFIGGRTVADHATEVLIREGCLLGGRAFLDMLVVDMAGQVHEGWLQRGENPVCITFELVLDISVPRRGA